MVVSLYEQAPNDYIEAVQTPNLWRVTFPKRHRSGVETACASQEIFRGIVYLAGVAGTGATCL